MVSKNQKLNKMKKAITIVILVLSITTYSQPFLGIAAGNGIIYHAGYKSGNIETTVSHRMPFNKNDQPNITTLSACYQILGIFTPSIGISNYRVKDFANYNADPTGKAAIEQISKILPNFGIEVGQSKHMGRYFIQVNYCKVVYYGIGIKVYFE